MTNDRRTDKLSLWGVIIVLIPVKCCGVLATGHPLWNLVPHFIFIFKIMVLFKSVKGKVIQSNSATLSDLTTLSGTF